MRAMFELYHLMLIEYKLVIDSLEPRFVRISNLLALTKG
jgi:hypothetical protein